jgi:GTP-binding protein
MKVTHAAFLKSALRLEDCPLDGRPEVAFCGRSNVGKSSLLNTLLGRKGLAKTSKTPGKTQTLNFFNVNNRLYLVDLPGYGFAKVRLSLKKEWSEAMLRYLREREQLALVVHLIDSRHKPSPLDHEMLDLLEEARKPTLLVATKFDKLKQTERTANITRIRGELGLDDTAVIVPFSSMTQVGHKELWRYIEDTL